MIYGYIRVSSDKQTVENQRFEIIKFCKEKGIHINGRIEETISGTKDYSKRKLGRLLHKVKNNDLIICSELSRLGRTLFMIMEILNLCMNKGVKIRTIKDWYRLWEDIQSKVLAFAFGLSAEIERNLISQRTREALIKRKAEGKKLGRPLWSINKRKKLDWYKEKINKRITKGITKVKIAKKLKVHRSTLNNFLKEQKEFFLFTKESPKK